MILLLACAVEVGEPTYVEAIPTEPGRPWKRMNIDQLGTSLEVATGERWQESVDGETVELFEQLSGSLGKPDYLGATDEDLTPGLLYQKFLDDAAKATCSDMVANDPVRGLSDRVFFVSDDKRIVIEHALLRFHGRRATSGELDDWQGLYGALESSSGSSSQAWTGLCVALITHPDFSAY